MKKTRFKRLLSLSIVILISSFLLWNCHDEKDFTTEPQAFGLFDLEHRRVSHLENDEIPIHIQDYLYKETSGTYHIVQSKSKGGFRLSQGQDRSTVFGTIDESTAVAVSLSGQTRYTFLVEPSIPNPDELINLIIIDDEVATQEYFVKYEFDSNRQVRTAFDDTDMTQFTGKISYFDSDGTPTGEFTVENGETTSSDGSGTPCPPDDSDDPNDPNDPTNDDNDSGAGNGGCTVNCGGDGHDDNTNEPGGGDGGGNGSEICSVEIRYDACCNGNVEPHGEEECGCGPGNLDTMTITISCQGGSRTADLEPFECDNTIGVLLKDDDCDTSKEDLKKIFPSASDSDMELLASVINDKGKDFGIDNAIKLQHFLAQAGHETGGFTTLNVTESTYWTTASKLAKTYSKFTMDSAQASTNANLYYAPSYLQNSSGVANIAMCCQYGNGNVESGDGYKYRGRGIFQLTWKDNYSAFKTWYNNKYDPDKDFVTNPGLVSSNDTIAILSGLWYYKTRVLDKITIDSTTTVSKVTIPINSAEKGIKDRKAKFKKAKDSIKCL